MRSPSDTARLFVTQAVAKVAAELERAGLVSAGHSPEAAEAWGRAGDVDTAARLSAAADALEARFAGRASHPA